MTFYNVHKPSYTCKQEGSIISHTIYLNLDVYIQNYCFSQQGVALITLRNV